MSVSRLPGSITGLANCIIAIWPSPVISWTTAATDPCTAAAGLEAVSSVESKAADLRLWTTAAEMADVKSGRRLAVTELEAVEEVD